LSRVSYRVRAATQESIVVAVLSFYDDDGQSYGCIAAIQRSSPTSSVGNNDAPYDARYFHTENG
jgi:hypothetical protein